MEIKEEYFKEYNTYANKSTHFLISKLVLNEKTF